VSHVVVTARLEPGAAPKAAERLRGLDTSGLDQLRAFVGEDAVVLLVEGDIEPDLLPAVADRLKELIDQEPSLAREVFGWEHPAELEGVSFGPDPGPGDSEGGERD
jgi:hypothetical protein